MDNATFNSTNATFDDGKPKPFWTNLLSPTLYLAILIGSLYTFSSLYRKRQISKAARLEPWFPPHRNRDIYLSLLHLDPAEGSEGGDGEKRLSKVPDSILKAALLQRALEDIKRIVQLRTSKPALQTLLQRGSVSDELWQRFLRAEQEMEQEVKDVVNEANAFAPNWGQTIFQSANEMNQNLLIKQRVAELEEQLESEKQWWEKKREGTRSAFMKEIGAEESTHAAAESRKGYVPETEKEQERRNGRSSDEDGVMVEAPPAEVQGGGPGSGGGIGRKKRGKK